MSHSDLFNRSVKSSTANFTQKLSINARVISSGKVALVAKNKANSSKTINSSHRPDGERLSKIMAARGMCSRREADAFIERGMVLVDGVRVSQLGTRVLAGAEITLEKAASEYQMRQRTIILHKPMGYVSGQPEPDYVPAVTLITANNYFHRHQLTPSPAISTQTVWGALKGLAPAGRLDIDSTGLLVMTQDGRIARQLIGENSNIEKEYLVRVNCLPTAEDLQRLAHGLSLDGKALRLAKVTIQNDNQLMFILREGKKRQIRRMCELVGLRVLGLKRVRIGRINLANLPLGQWRFLQEGENF